MQFVLHAFLRGMFDSIKGFYWLFHLDSKQRRAVSYLNYKLISLGLNCFTNIRKLTSNILLQRHERATYQDMRATKRNNHSPTHQYPQHVDKE